MTSSNDITLAISFYNARYNEDGEFSRNERARLFERNAGAVQLYKNGVAYCIPGKEGKNYNFVSYGNKEFKDETKRDFEVKRSSYGHSERCLMRDILDDLIEADGESPDVKRPSELSECTYTVLKRLTDHKSSYKEYLERKGLTVKMWSERPACEKSPVDGVGNGCLSFIEGIFPTGSQFGYIVQNYTPADNKTPTKIEQASADLKSAYINFKQKCL